MKHVLAAGLCLGLLGAVDSAAAAGFASARFGGEHGNVTEVNPTALYFNPGAMGSSQGIHLYVDGTLALRGVSWTHAPAPSDPADPPGAEGANSGRSSVLNVFGAPMLGFTWRIKDFTLGAAIYVPFGGRVHWPREDSRSNSPYPRTADGVQRWHSIEGALTYVYSTLGAAYRLGPLSVGASANLVHSAVYSNKAKYPTGSDPDTVREGRATLDVSRFQGSFGVGVLLEAMQERLWIGASYQAQPGLGPMRLRGTLALQSSDSEVVPYPVTFDQALPDILRAGVRYRPSPTLELRLFGDMTRWSVMKTQCVAVDGYPCLVDNTGADAGRGGVLLNLRRNWQDTFGVRLGGSHWLRRSLELFVGAGFETAAVPDATLEPELPDATTISGALGARVELPAKWFLGGSFTHLYFFDRDNTGKSELSSAMLPTRRADAGGRYTQWISLINANIEKEF